MLKNQSIDNVKKSINKHIPEVLIEDYLLLKSFKDQKSEKYISAVKLSIHVYIVHSDLTILFLNHKACKNTIERKFYARIASIMIYEYLKDINTLLGNKFVKELIKNGFDEFVSESKELNKEFSTFKKEHKDLFKHIRNNIGAHKSSNTELLISSVFEIDDGKIIDSVRDIIKINNKLFKLIDRTYEKIYEYKDW